MSESSKQCRVTRSEPSIQITKSNYRKKALPYLLHDFSNRCAYSMEYIAKQAEVDHFNPNKKRDPIQEYNNLFPASRHCNRAKSSTWPTVAMQSNGIRFLDCTKEIDYGKCIFENPETYELTGTTPSAKWHINELDLNAPFLIKKRRQRAEFRRYLSSCPVHAKKSLSEMGGFLNEVQICHELLNEMIPEIPALPTA